jgi:hypothetical protein
MPAQNAIILTLAVDLSPRTEDPMPDSWAEWMKDGESMAFMWGDNHV